MIEIEKEPLSTYIGKITDKKFDKFHQLRLIQIAA